MGQARSYHHSLFGRTYVDKKV